MDTPHLNWRKTVCFMFTITSMLPQIILKLDFCLWKMKESLWKTQHSFILMNFHWSSPKSDCRNRYTTSKLKENSLFHVYNNSHVATNNSQVRFQSVENWGITMKKQCSFILMNFHWSPPKTDCTNGYTTSRLRENSWFHVYNNIHVATNYSQVSFKSVKNEGNTLKNTLFFYFYELPLKPN